MELTAATPALQEVCSTVERLAGPHNALSCPSCHPTPPAAVRTSALMTKSSAGCTTASPGDRASGMALVQFLGGMLCYSVR